MFIVRLLARLVHLRHGVTHDVLACWFDVDHSAITRAIGELRPLIDERGCTVSPGVRLRTVAEPRPDGAHRGRRARRGRGRHREPLPPDRREGVMRKVLAAAAAHELAVFGHPMQWPRPNGKTTIRPT
ncbi:transposase family protein [Streptomyces sp. NRRL S-340]|uniref:helix-turn-helix domain-containing protein n=1 Tax=Streptomyces sp. NRRL S-340 TaxID=1463901 RepID=UPI002D219540|nr:transposase family protein [Streptomyces sp. NRRL S-340]